MKFINFVIMLVLFLANSCTKTEYETKRDLENKMIGKTWKQLEQEKNLIPLGEGGGSIEGEECFELIFQYFQPLTIDQARELVIYAADTFLHNLNSDEKLNELIDKPYPMNWIEITIFIYSDHAYSKIPPPGLTLVELQKNKITYYYKRKKPQEDQRHFETIHEETYEKAIEKLKLMQRK